jgi:hypothetical protein
MFTLLLVSFTSPAYAVTAFFSHEIPGGVTKVCVYKSYKGTHAITIDSWRPCPGTIEA